MYFNSVKLYINKQNKKKNINFLFFQFNSLIIFMNSLSKEFILTISKI